MTLSRFLRDYLYIPLGGSRGGRLFTYRNLFITMLLGGLWHGAAWTFVLWGAFHGAMLVAEHAWAKRVALPGWFRWLRHVPPRRLRLGPVPGAGSRIALDFLGQLASPGAATLVTIPVVLAILAAIGPQLVPSGGFLQSRAGSRISGPSRSGWPSGSSSSSSRPPSRARAWLPSSTSASRP
jgi:hypothetical protein